MKLTILVAFLLTCFVTVAEQVTLAEEENNNTTYNASLAEKLGADEYGMKMYVMAFLKKGPNRNQSAEQAATIQKAHLANIKRMAAEGSLTLAGPFAPNEQGIQGIYIFNVKTVAEAEALTKTDPAIKSGRLVMELIPWYGSAALMKVNEIGLTLAKKSF